MSLERTYRIANTQTRGGETGRTQREKRIYRTYTQSTPPDSHISLYHLPLSLFLALSTHCHVPLTPPFPRSTLPSSPGSRFVCDNVRRAPVYGLMSRDVLSRLLIGRAGDHVTKRGNLIGRRGMFVTRRTPGTIRLVGDNRALSKILGTLAHTFAGPRPWGYGEQSMGLARERDSRQSVRK